MSTTYASPHRAGGTKQTSAPAVEPVTLAEAKDQLRVCHNADDTRITNLIVAARQQAEMVSRRQFITATWELKLDDFPLGEDYIKLPYPPLQSVTSIAYIDADGVSQTLASSVYDVDTHREPGRITLAYNQSWPTIRDQENAVTVTFKAGYGDAAGDVPDAVKEAIKLYIEDLYDGRSMEDDDNALALLWGVRILEAA